MFSILATNYSNVIQNDNPIYLVQQPAKVGFFDRALSWLVFLLLIIGHWCVSNDIQGGVEFSLLGTLRKLRRPKISAISQGHESASILSKIALIYCLTSKKWRPSWI